MAKEKYEVKIAKIQSIAKNTKAFYLEKPNDYEYKSGQFFDVSLHKASTLSGEVAVHTFSIASAPHEKELLFATRIRESEYKQALDKVSIGDILEISAPGGNFTLHEDMSIPAIFLTGGIGMTTVISILKDVKFLDKKHTLVIIDSNRTPEEAPFLGELFDIDKEMDNLKYIGTMTKAEKSGVEWSGETGTIDTSMIDKYVSNPKGSRFYLVGPPGLVEHLENLLKTANISENMIKKENYPGY